MEHREGKHARGMSDQSESNQFLGSRQTEIAQLVRRLVRESGLAVAMLEDALDALWTLDTELAERVRKSDDRVDQEEVEIERAALTLLSKVESDDEDFRTLAFVLKVNADVERVADHAHSIAKIVIHLSEELGGQPPRWPTALEDLALRVPAMCHALLRAVLDRDGRAALAILRSDKTIDQLDRLLFEETIDSMHHAERSLLAGGLLMHRVGRELERVGDLMKSIAEELIYRETGTIVRHQGRQARIDAVETYEAEQRSERGEGAA